MSPAETIAAWGVGAAFVYAGATAYLAWVTRIASIRASNATASAAARSSDATVTAARVQALVSAVSINRQGWINQLRDEVTGFVAENERERSIADGYYSIIGASQVADRARAQGLKRRHFYKIQLLIKPTEEPLAALVELLRPGLVDVVDLRQEAAIVTLAQSILKREWERVKKGE